VTGAVVIHDIKLPPVVFHASSLARQRVLLEHQFLEALFKHVGVDLGGCDISVAEQLLHRAQVRPAVQQMAREGMAQDVRTDALWVDVSGFSNRFQILADTLTRQMPFGTAWERATWMLPSSSSRSKLEKPGAPLEQAHSAARGVRGRPCL
jgi:hypothetical protein